MEITHRSSVKYLKCLLCITGVFMEKPHALYKNTSSLALVVSVDTYPSDHLLLKWFNIF